MTDNNRLGTLTDNYARIAAAASWFRARITKGALGDQTESYDDLTMTTLKGTLDPAHYAQLARSVEEYRRKGTVAPMSMTSDPSLAEPYGWPTAFRDLAHAAMALFKIGGAKIPLNVYVPSIASSAVVADFFAEGNSVPVNAFTTALSTMSPFKLGVAQVWTKEVATSTVPSVQAVVERDLRRKLAIGVDKRAWDPDFAGSAGVSPAAIPYGATQIVPNDNETGIRDLTMTISGGNPESPWLVTNPRVAVYFASQRNSNGARLFPDVSINGGSIFGVPVAVGSGVPDCVVAIDASALVIGDGGIDVSLSSESAVQMDSAPGTGGQSRVSLFQNNLVAIQAVQRINWVLGRTDAVAYMRVPIGGSPF